MVIMSCDCPTLEHLGVRSFAPWMNQWRALSRVGGGNENHGTVELWDVSAVFLPGR
jgi:hypothetical protein